MTSSYQLLSATRYDPFLVNLRWNQEGSSGSPFLLLHYHLDRLRAAARLHGWVEAERSLSWHALESECNKAVEPYAKLDKPRACKIRLILAESGVLTATANLLPWTLNSDPTSASFFKPDLDAPSLYGAPIPIILDSEPTPSSRFTRTKTTNRGMYDAARARHGINSLPSSHLDVLSPGDVLLYNPQNMITETSVFNVAFYRSNRWMTPPESSGCLPGILRRWLLEQGRISEARDGILTRDSVEDGECVLLMNGVRGCQLGRVVIRPSDEVQKPDGIMPDVR